MNRRVLTLLIVSTGLTPIAHAQRPQDNWYQEYAWTKTNSAATGGLSSPLGCAISRDGRIYVGDADFDRVQVYQQDGTFLFGITNTFGTGDSFSSPRGMVFDRQGSLYVADAARSAVFQFTPDGVFIRKYGGVTGSNPGQLNGVQDVAVDSTGQVYVLEYNTSRVSVFASDGTYVTNWGGGGAGGNLDAYLQSPVSIAVGPDNKIYVCQCPIYQDVYHGVTYPVAIKLFTPEGRFLEIWPYLNIRQNPGGYSAAAGPVSVRVDDGNVVHIFLSLFGWASVGGSAEMRHLAYIARTTDGSVLRTFTASWGSAIADTFQPWPFHAVGSDGSMAYVSRYSKRLFFERRALRDQWSPPHNLIPMPAVTRIQQRQGEALVDIDYEITDADDTNVTAAALIFRSGNQAISNCLRNLTLVTGTATNLGPGIAANVPHRITWDAGADWGVSLGNYRVALLAKDSRTNLLDIHYLHLPAGNSMPALTISRSPLNSNDYMQVWWWILATNDTTIGINSNQIVGVGGSYDGQVLCNGGATTLSGRNFVHERLNVREATPAEVSWARQAALPGNTNRFTAVSVGGRPIAVNEYGFDTGDWGTNAFWVVPLN